MTTKLEPQADKCFFIGYPKETKGYYFWHKSTNRILVERGAVFLEKEFFKRMKSDKSGEMLEQTQESLQDLDNLTKDIDIGQSSSTVPVASGSMSEQVHQPIEEEVHTSPYNIEQTSQEIGQYNKEPQEPRRSARPKKKHDFYLGLHEILIMDTEDPMSFQEAMNIDDSK